MSKREIQMLLEEKLGYEFKLQELPPHLRAKIRELEEERNILRREEYLYEDYKREAESGLQRYLRGISESYDKKIEEAQGHMSHIDWVPLGSSFLLLCFGVIVVWIVTAAYGAPPGITFLLIWFIGPFLFFLSALLYTLWRIANRATIKRKIANLKEEKEEALRHGTNEYNSKFLPELEVRVHAQEQKYRLLQEKFERDLSQLCSEINSTLSIVFQGRMDFGLLRSIMKNRGIVIERIECPYCGGSINLPETGHVTKCPYCGRNVYVADVFKELEKRF
jgi:ribosomal protein S27AE